VETGRGKKGKKAGWHLTLGVKDAIFAGIGLVGLLMISFALGALAGRGDIYRAAYSWGLLAPDGAKVAQWMPAPGPPGVAPAGTSGTATSTTVAAAVAPGPAPAPSTPGTPAPGTAAPARPGPVTGSIAPLPPPAAAKKKGKTETGATHRDHKAREEELRQVRQEVVQKLKFQNSFDTGPKAKLPKAKDHDKSQPTQVRVAEYRTTKEAQARVAELNKKGVKATLKTTKDSKGALYIVYKPASPVQPAADKIVQKPEKSSSAAPKPKPNAE
jgi:hypothetical protein